MSGRLRVLHVVPGLDPASGGPARSVLGLARAQATCGAHVDIVAGGDPGVALRETTGVRVRFGPNLPVPFSIPRPRLTQLLREAIREADVVHLHSVWNGTITQAAWLCRSADKPMLLSPRGMLDRHNMQRRARLKRLYLRAFEQGNLAAVAGFHFLHETERAGCDWLVAANRVPHVIQPNGLNLGALQQRLADLPSGLLSPSVPDDLARHMVFLGRLNVIKGLELQLEALADVRDAGLRVHLHLIGPDDGEGTKLRALAARLGVAEAVHWHGPIYGDERLGWLREADAVLLTSHYECNSNMAAEALAVGGVLVATDTCHLDRPAAAGAARVVPRSREQLTAALLDVLGQSTSTTALRERALAFARADLDWHPLAERMLAFYQHSLAGAPACAA